MRRDEHFQIIYTSLEDDPDFLKLSSTAKLTFYTLKCNPSNNAINLFPIYWEALRRHSSLTRELLEDGIEDLWRAGFVAFQYPVVWIVNGMKYNPYCDPGNANQLINIYKLLANTPRQTIIGDFCRYYRIEPPLELLFKPKDGLVLPVPEEIIEAGVNSGKSWNVEGPMIGPPGGGVDARSLLKINIKDKGLKNKNESSLPPDFYLEVITDLNDKLAARAQEAGRVKAPRGFQSTTRETRRLIDILIREGKYSLDDFKKVHDIKIDNWYGTEFENNLNPGSLYKNPAKFETYLNQKTNGEISDVGGQADRVRENIKARAPKPAR